MAREKAREKVVPKTSQRFQHYQQPHFLIKLLVAIVAAKRKRRNTKKVVDPRLESNLGLLSYLGRHLLHLHLTLTTKMSTTKNRQSTTVENSLPKNNKNTSPKRKTRKAEKSKNLRHHITGRIYIIPEVVQAKTGKGKDPRRPLQQLLY